MSRNYLLKRKDLILAAFFDSIIFYFINNFYNNNNNDQYFLIFIWILISYVIGRYNYKSIKKLKFLIISISLFLISIILFSIFIILLNYFNFSIAFNSIITNYNFLIYTFISLSLINFVNCFTTNNNFLFLGSISKFEEFKDFVFSTNNNYKIKFLDGSDDLYSENNNKYKNIVIYDAEFINKIDLNKLKFDYKNFDFIEITKFQERFLYRIKPETLNKYLYNKANNNEFLNVSQLIFKRLLDIVGSIILILFTSSIIVIASILILIDDGIPILFTQKRTGQNLSIFNIYKLRTMRKNSEINGPQWSNSNDSRIIKVGKFIRMARIDELPQLFLVLIGKMSLIGPRPERPEIEKNLVEQIPNFYYRYKVKPGLSGWAQVNYPYGASIKDAYNKLSYDLFYITNFSILLDLIIFFKTLKTVFTLQGAIPKK
tara:strand:- start:850 stop:2139 length:1290 start_codon:yes stop_codon:yes gene_type:complete